MQMGFTEQRLIPHGGLVLMSAFTARLGWHRKLAATMPYAPVNMALSFMAGVLAGASHALPVSSIYRRAWFPPVSSVRLDRTTIFNLW